MLEAEGLKVPDVMRVYFDAEIRRHNFTPMDELESAFDNLPQPLPHD